jgi:ribonuclease BN (tRNA processing enzyme)
MLRPILAVLIALAPTAQPEARTACPDAGVSLQVLGSGGPIADDARAASGYLVRHDGEARVLIDAGGGTFQRFGAAGVSLDTLDVIAITHVHTDHAADLPALLKGAYFSDRADPLPVAGPDGNARFPGIDTFLARLFDAETGAFAYLAGLLDGSGSLFRLDPVVVDRSAREPVTVLDDPDLTVTAIGVHHGPVPSLAYRIELDGKAIVVSGDQNLSTEGFVDFARGADLLVMPFAIPESAGGIARNLHARPSEIGTAAADAEVEHLVLSHFMARSLRNRDREIARVKQRYPGRLTAARDLACLAP